MSQNFGIKYCYVWGKILFMSALDTYTIVATKLDIDYILGFFGLVFLLLLLFFGDGVLTAINFVKLGGFFLFFGIS